MLCGAGVRSFLSLERRAPCGALSPNVPGEKGCAWAASSYSKNYYDVRVGIEDANALTLAFNAIATANGRTLAAPSKTFTTGHSMGGHIAAAAVEAETQSQARNKVRYAGARRCAA